MGSKYGSTFKSRPASTDELSWPVVRLPSDSVGGRWDTTGLAQWCTKDQDTAEVMKTMTEATVRRLPVINGERELVDIVFVGDIATKAPDPVEAMLREISDAVAARWRPGQLLERLRLRPTAGLAYCSPRCRRRAALCRGARRALEAYGDLAAGARRRAASPASSGAARTGSARSRCKIFAPGRPLTVRPRARCCAATALRVRGPSAPSMSTSAWATTREVVAARAVRRATGRGRRSAMKPASAVHRAIALASRPIASA